jgi:asparagine synthase (glutamine-hydrolysing)
MLYEHSYACSVKEFPGLGIQAGWVGQMEDAEVCAPTVHSRGGTSLFAAGEPYVNRGTCSTGRSAQPNHPRRYIIEAYEESGNVSLSDVSGLFSGFIVDERRGRSVLFTDRFGIERLFTYEDREKFVFSSEAKAILAAVPQTRNFDLAGLAEFLACGCTLGERSLFAGIAVMPGGVMFELQMGHAARRRTYFEAAAWEGLAPFPEQEYVENLAETLAGTVRTASTSPSRVAVSLTGGLDSRMVMAFLEAPTGSVPCYTFGSMYRDTYDVRVGRAVAKVCGQPHQVVVLGDKFLGAPGEYLEKAVFVSDGLLGLSGAAELYLNGLAKTVAPIRITGNYGGELLRGNRAFKCVEPKGAFLSTDVAKHMDGVRESFSVISRVRPLSFTLFWQAPSGYGRYAIERSQVTVRSPFLGESFVRLLYQNPFSFDDHGEVSAALIARRRADLLRIPTDRGLYGRGGQMATKSRRAFRELLFKGEYWTGYGAPDVMAALTHQMPGRLLESLFVGRHKFLHPRIWMRGQLGDYVREVLSAGALQTLASFFDVPAISTMLADHLSGRRNYWGEIDKLVTISLTARLLLRSNATPLGKLANPTVHINLAK